MSSPAGSRSPRAGGFVSGLRQAVDALRPAPVPDTAVRLDRNEVRDAVLSALADQPMNGYEIVRTLQEQGAGSRTPGAGSVYPMLQLLADGGLATADEEGGRKVYSLTASGQVAARAARDRPAAVPPADARAMRGSDRRGALAKSGSQLAQTVALAAQTGTPQQVAEAVAVLDDARRKLFAILART